MSVWGSSLSLSTQSGFSSNVELVWTAGRSTGARHMLCGIDNAPAAASIVYAGP